MNLIKIRSFNAVRAAKVGYKLTATQKLILLRSSPHTHTEIQFSARHGHRSYSATTMDGSNCSRFADIEYSHEIYWDTVLVWVTDEQEDLIYQEALCSEGTLYDVIGQLCHISKLNWWKPNPNKTWCTKIVGRCLYKGRPDFLDYLSKYTLTNELRPDIMHLLASYYFGENKPKPL